MCINIFRHTVLRNFLKMLTYPLLWKNVAKIKAENGNIVSLCWGYFIFECRFILKEGHLSSCIVLTCTLPSSFKSNSHCCRLLIYFFAVSSTQSLYRILFWYSWLWLKEIGCHHPMISNEKLFTLWGLVYKKGGHVMLGILCCLQRQGVAFRNQKIVGWVTEAS